MNPSENKAVFLSYASQDAEAARRICDALRAAGVEVWFDQSELRGGDAWDAKIRKQIKECALFVPVISAATQARREGYFRLEWKLAAQRTHMMSEQVAFLLPVVIDATRDAEADVPAEFKAVQWTRLAGDSVNEAFCARVQRLSAEGGTVPATLAGLNLASPTPSRTPRRSTRRGPGMMSAVGALVLALGLTLWQPWRTGTRPGGSPGAAATGAGTEAQRLVAQARQVYEEGDELNRENLFLAEDLVKRALERDPAEPAAVEMAARLSYFMVWQQLDNSDARIDALRRQAARARALAPQSVSAHIMSLNARMTGVWVTSGTAQEQELQEIERELRSLAQREPANWQVQRSLGMVCRFLGRPDDSIAALRRAVQLSGRNPSAISDLANVLERRKRLDEYETVVASGLRVKPTARLLAQDVFGKIRWRGDLAAARTSIESWPAWLLQEDRGLFIAWQAYFWSRQPDKALALVRRMPRDYLRDAWFAGPRAVLTARAHETAGHREAAETDWRSVVQVADRELALKPEDSAALYWKAWALARLGETGRARTLCTVLQQQTENARSSFFKGTNLAPLLLTVGLTEPAMADVQTQLTSFNDNNALTRAMLHLEPAYDAVRGDPRFPALLAAAPAPEKTAAALRPDPPDSKSIVVLPLANLSDDKDSGYFADGVHEDILIGLGGVRELRVTSRTTAVRYRETKLSTREIAAELGVTYVCEGSVRRAGNTVRVTGKLIDARTDRQVWADAFSGELTDVFALQAKVATAIARALQATLSPEEEKGLARKPTGNLAAYEAFLKARDLLNRHGTSVPGPLREQRSLLREAVALDPAFAPAWARLAWVYSAALFWGVNQSEEMRVAAQQAIETADRLAPDDPEVILGRGYYHYHAFRDYDRAAREFDRLIAQRPFASEPRHAIANLEKRRGRFLVALAGYEAAVRLDRGFVDCQWQVYFMNLVGRRYDAVLRQLSVLAELGEETKMHTADIHFRLTGSTTAGDTHLEQMTAEERESPLGLRLRVQRALQLGQLDEAIRLDTLRAESRLETWRGESMDIIEALIVRGQQAKARERIEPLEVRTRRTTEDNPNNDRAWARLARLESLLGNHDAAFRAVDRALELVPPSVDVWRALSFEWSKALILAWAGRKDEAIAEFGRQLQRPTHWLNVNVMRRHPAYFPLQGDPRFEALLNDPKNNAPLF